MLIKPTLIMMYVYWSLAPDPSTKYAEHNKFATIEQCQAQIPQHLAGDSRGLAGEWSAVCVDSMTEKK